MHRTLYPRAQIMITRIKLMPNHGCGNKYSGKGMFSIIGYNLNS